MKILWFTWKDLSHPHAGGAEVVNEELAKRLVADKHEVVFLVGGFRDCKKEESRHGFRIIRLGNKFTVYTKAFLYYRKYFKNWPDLIIEEVNTVPFFTRFYVHQKTILFFHQLAREVWFYQITFPFNWIGYILEPVYLLLLRKSKVITISNSTQKDLIKYGFQKENINIIIQGMNLKPIDDVEKIEKYENLTVLSLGAIRPMKRTLDQIKAFEISKKIIPSLRMKIAGDAKSDYGLRVLKYIKKSRFVNDIEFLGKVSYGEKLNLMQKSHIITVTSIKEGWGLIVTEANSQGTVAITYDIDGLRDSIINGKTGLLSNKNTPESLADKIIEILNDAEKYKELQKNALQKSRGNNFENSYRSFLSTIKK